MLKNRALPLLVLLAVTVVFPASLEAQELTNALTSEEVRCNEVQLENLLQRLQLADRGQRVSTLFVSYNEQSFYEGLGSTRQGPGSPVGVSERYLAFHTNPDVRSLLVYPLRPPIDGVSLTRENPASNLVAASSPDAMELRLNPLLGAGAPPWPANGLLVINSFVENQPGEPYNGFLSSSVQPGRGLEQAGLLTACHHKFTRFDRYVFALLQRMVSVSATTQIGGSDIAQFDMKAAIFREEDPHFFRIYAYPTSGLITNQRVAARLRVDWTADGKLTTGALDALPVCSSAGQGACTQQPQAEEIRVTLAPPVWGGHGQRVFAAPPAATVSYSTIGFPAISHADVDFGALLINTSWNGGGFVP